MTCVLVALAFLLSRPTNIINGLKPGDVVGVRERSKTMEVINASLSRAANVYPWMDFDKTSMTGKFIAVPERSQIPENIKEQLIVELYSK